MACLCEPAGDGRGKKEKASDKLSKESDAKLAETIEATLDYGIQEDRSRALTRLGAVRDEQLKKKIASKIGGMLKAENDPELLIKMLQFLGEMKESPAVPAIMEKMDHPTEDVRTAAVYALKTLNATQSKDRILAVLKDRDLKVNSNYTDALIRTLGDFKAAEVMPLISDPVKSQKTGNVMRESMIACLASLGTQEGKDMMLALYVNEDEDPGIRATAINALGRLKYAAAGPKIKEFLVAVEGYPIKKRQQLHNLYMYSLTALAGLGDADAVPRLMESLKNNNAQVRLKAVTLLGEIKDKRTIDILKYKMEHDPSDKVRKAASNVLKDMGVIQDGKEPSKK